MRDYPEDTMPTTALKFNFLTTHPVKVYPSVHDMYHRNDQRLKEVGPGEYEIVDRGRDFDLLDLSKDENGYYYFLGNDEVGLGWQWDSRLVDNPVNQPIRELAPSIELGRTVEVKSALRIASPRLRDLQNGQFDALPLGTYTVSDAGRFAGYYEWTLTQDGSQPFDLGSTPEFFMLRNQAGDNLWVFEPLIFCARFEMTQSEMESVVRIPEND
jgi:hypothetical protein